tara:strand:- start:346 stop:792 length:447 start_codon:yes stop_codon:yes gene_type:complete
MGIKLYIGKDLPNVSLSFSEWDNFKINAVNALFRYIEYTLIVGKYKKIEDRALAKNLETDLMDIINEQIEDLSFDQIDTLIYFDLCGIYYFVNKDTFQGHYSLGNSYDIYQTLLILKEYFRPQDQIIVDNFIDLFRLSFNSNLKVHFT